MSEKRRCILHVGTMKTGTKSIQSWLTVNSSWLDDQGWHYAGYPMRSAATIGTVVDELASDKNLIISDEALWHFSGSPRSDTTAIREILADFDTTVVVYLRRPDDFLESWFAQGLKHGSGKHDVRGFLDTPSTSATKMRARLKLFTKLWEDDCFRFRPYESSQFVGGDLVADFLAATGLPAPEAQLSAETESARHNVTPSADQLLVAGLLRKLGCVPEAQIQAMLSLPTLATESGVRHRLFNPDEAARVKADFRPFYRRIQRRWGSGTSPDFIADWGDDDPRPVAALRPVYDHFMATVDI